MAALIEKMDKFDKDFREKYILFLKELQAKKPKGKALYFSTCPEDEEESFHVLNSNGIRKAPVDEPQKGKYMSPHQFVYEYNMTHGCLVTTLEGLQREIEKHGIEIDWNKIMS